MITTLRETLRKLPFGDVYRYLREFFIYLRVPSETPYGFKFIGTKKMVSGRFEPDVTALIIEEVKRGARTFIDVGAHHGFFTILASHYGLATYSFEPDPLNYRVLKRNMRVSHSKTSKINNIGLSNFNDKVTFFGFATGVSRNSNWAGSNSRRKFVVEVFTLDKSLSLQNLQEPILVKVDVEGYESEVMEGAIGVFAIHRDITIICEITFSEKQINGESHSIKALKMSQSLVAQGFEIFTITLDGNLRPTSISELVKINERNEFGVSANFVFKRNIMGFNATSKESKSDES